MKKILIAVALLPLTFLTACAVYPDGDYQDGYGRHTHRGDYRYHDNDRNRHGDDERGDRDRYGYYDGDYDRHRGQGYYCPPGQAKKGRC